MKLENLDPIPLEELPLDKHLSEPGRVAGPPLTSVQKLLHDVLPLDADEPLAKSVRLGVRIGQRVRDTDGAVGVLTAVSDSGMASIASPTDDERMMKALLVPLRNGLTQMLLSYFDAIRSQPAELYKTFAAKVLIAGDSIITFNYDLALDRELAHTDKWDISDGYGFELDTVPRTKSACTLLKLHGSANWRGELFQGMKGFFQMSFKERSLGQRPIIQASEFEFLGYGGRSDPKARGANASIPSLIMPTAKKQFYMQTSVGREREEFWNSLWSQAAAALRAANEVYLIGYSVPEYDTRARNLFATTINENAKLRICCHDGTFGVIESLKVLNLHARPACSTTFEGWLAVRGSALD